MIKVGILGHPKSVHGCLDGELTPNADGPPELTPLQIWDAFKDGSAVGRPGFNDGVVLQKWVCKCKGERFRDYAPADGPALADGDEVTFYVQKATGKVN